MGDFILFLQIIYSEPHIFNIGEDAVKGLPPHEEGGRCRQVKVPTHISHKSFQASLAEPEYAIWDFAKFDFPDQLHALWTALYSFEAKHGRSPAPRSDSDVDLLKAELPSSANVDDKLLKFFTYQVTYFDFCLGYIPGYGKSCYGC